MWYWWVLLVRGEKSRKVFSTQGFPSEQQATQNLEARTMQSVPDIRGFQKGDYIADTGLDFRARGFPK